MIRLGSWVDQGEDTRKLEEEEEEQEEDFLARQEEERHWRLREKASRWQLQVRARGSSWRLSKEAMLNPVFIPDLKKSRKL